MTERGRRNKNRARGRARDDELGPIQPLVVPGKDQDELERMHDEILEVEEEVQPDSGGRGKGPPRRTRNDTAEPQRRRREPPPAPEKQRPIAVLGSEGALGSLVTSKLWEHYYVAALIHGPSDFIPTNLHLTQKARPLVRFSGDATELDDLRILLRGCQAVVSCIGRHPGSSPDLMDQVSQNLILAMKEEKVNRLIWMSTALLPSTLDSPTPEWSRAIESAEQLSSKELQDAERATLRIMSTGFDWTVFRAPTLINGDQQKFKTGYIRSDFSPWLTRTAAADAIVEEVKTGRWKGYMPALWSPTELQEESLDSEAQEASGSG